MAHIKTLPPDQISRLPRRPGVYLFRDAKNIIIYIGKAKSLKDRVRNYFGKQARLDIKTHHLAARIASVDFIVTHSEKEALILEDTLIKQHRPRYNVDLKDDKRYLCIRIDSRHPFPAIRFVRRFQPDGAFYAGPFTSAESVRKTIKLLHRYFPLRSCSDSKFKQRSRPCLNYQIHRCLAPCVGYITKENYAKLLNEAKLFLTGNREGLVQNLRKEMEQAAGALDFERAAAVRDELKAISKTLEKQTIASPTREDMDAFGMVRREDWWGIFVAFFRNGCLMGSHYSEMEDAGLTAEEVLSNFLVQFYGRNSLIPERILLPEQLDDMLVLEEWLTEKKGEKLHISVPKRGEKKKLVTLATENARVKFAALTHPRREALATLKDTLALSKIPERIECYDISTLQGAQPVGAKVCFLNGVPEKSRYRRFRIKQAAGGDDVGSMTEVLLRSLKREQSEKSLPDMVLLDGGKGQLAAGEEVFRELGIGSVVLVALAKGRSMGKRFSDYFLMPGRKEPIILDPIDPVFKLLTRIRDEAHRFAITYHRKRRGREALASGLSSIPGIGPRRLKILYGAYPSIEAIRNAPEADIAALPTFSKTLATKLIMGLKGKDRRKKVMADSSVLPEKPDRLTTKTPRE